VNEQDLEPASAIPVGQNAPRSPSISWKWFSAQPYRFHFAEQSRAEQRGGDATTLIPQQRSFEAAQ